MKASELMFGDWVKLSKGNWSKNRQVGLTDIEMIAESVYLAEPIPLTPEILEKNSLVFDGTQTWKLNDKKLDIMVVPVQPDNEFWDEFSTRIEVCTNKSDMLIEAVRQIYVHQLQQMLRIAGSDKEIVL